MQLCYTKNIQSDVPLQSTYDEVDSDCFFKLSSKQLRSLQAVIYCVACFLPALLFCCVLQGKSQW